MHLFASPTTALPTLLCSMFMFILSRSIRTVLATDINLQPRKNVDHNIVCPGPIPVAETWPAEAPSRSLFNDLTHLCGRVAGQPTVGCLCDFPYTGVYCPETGTISGGTNPILWQRYRVFCEMVCDCAPSTRPASSDGESDSGQRGHHLNVPFPGLSIALPRPTPPSLPISRTLHTIQEDSCGGACSSVTQQCSLESTAQCKCTAQPVGGAQDSMIRFSGSCAAVHSVHDPAGPRHDNPARDDTSTSHLVADGSAGFFAVNGDRVACPCNATYVSYGCCESRTGIVWETPDKKLGELKASA